MKTAPASAYDANRSLTSKWKGAHMEAETRVADEPDPTIRNLLAEARRLKALCDGIAGMTDAAAVIEYAHAVCDLAKATAVRIERLAERIAATSRCTETYHEMLKHAPREMFDANTVAIGVTDGPRRLPLGNCVCGTSLAWVGK